MAALLADCGVQFFLPDGIDGVELPKPEQKVCIVAMFGKSTRWQSKGSLLNKVINADVFPESVGERKALADNAAMLRGYYDVGGQVIYLELASACDMPRFFGFCESVAAGEQKDYLTAWDDEANKQARALALLFHVSHIVVLHSPGSCLDVSYIRLFRSLESIRHKLQVHISDLLQEFSLSSDWIGNGRPCSPRMLFVFGRCYLPLTPATSEEAKKKPSAIKKMQHCMEDQIYNILRKSRIITNISNYSLFAVPANEEFVYIMTQQKDARPDSVALLLSLMKQRSGSSAAAAGGGGGSAGSNGGVGVQLPLSALSNGDRLQQQQPADTGTAAAAGAGALPSHIQSSSFREFLMQHVEHALKKGFDDNVGRTPTPPAAFELVTVRTWFKVCRRMYDMLVTKPPAAAAAAATGSGGTSGAGQPKVQAALAQLRASLELDKRFSETRCSKVMALAENTYQDGLPKFYPQAVHSAKLAKARAVLLHGGRGPALGSYVRQLEESCERYWHGGRQLCEEVSLTGNHCVHELHRTPDAEITDENDKLPCKQHASQISFKATCNCGYSQGNKDDPFDLQYANHGFYADLEVGCCDRFEQLPFPVFVPSTPDVKPIAHIALDLAGQSSRTRKEARSDGDQTSGQQRQLPEEDEEAEGDDDDVMLMEENQLSQQAVAAADEAANDDDEERSAAEADNAAAAAATAAGAAAQELVSLNSPSRLDGDDAEGRSVATTAAGSAGLEGGGGSLSGGGGSLSEYSRPPTKASTTEYLPYMINNSSPPGLLPKFSSWSLKCLGKYSQYVPNLGLEQPGFCSGSNHLLPWDVVVKTSAPSSSSNGGSTSGSSRDAWPSIGEAKQKKKIPKKKEIVEMNVHIYIGDEYECPKGHRFFCSGPEKIIKVATSSVVKDNANRLLTMDMPLYFPCQCRSTPGGCMAQLVRLYIATPDTPSLTVAVYPKIQPAPAPCPLFVPSHDGPIQLPRNGLWVLRLPHIYCGENGPYYMPSDLGKLAACRMLKGAFSIRTTDDGNTSS